MGLLVVGTPLSWEESKKYFDHVRENGIEQFIHMYENGLKKTNDILLWGDEIEYIVLSVDEDHKIARVSLRQEDILEALEEHEKSGFAVDASSLISGMHNSVPIKPEELRELFHEQVNENKTPDLKKPFRAEYVTPTFHPEYGRYMVESTPGAPYGSTLEDLLNVEANMLMRRIIIQQHLAKNEFPVTLTNFPLLGAKDFTDPPTTANGPISRSFFLPDEVINSHVRFPTLTANIRTRRRRKVAMNVPIYVDKNTPQPFHDNTIPWDRDLFPEDVNAREGAALDNHIYMDSMGFGMGCCCLQLTFQTTGVDEARKLYDQLTPIAPLMMALSAATPVFRGFLAEQDCRWNVIAGAVDDRTEEELKTVPKSRYDSVDCYIANDPRNLSEYSDVPLVMNDRCYKQLRDAGIDEKLARHVAHIFFRDPLVIFSDSIHQDNTKSNGFFENLNSTNWQSIRFKPPPPQSNIGWRVEFRSLEVQLTDFENAAYAVFVVLLSRAILSFKLNFYMPISLVDENMKRAHARDAIHRHKFWFRRNPFPSSADTATSSSRDQFAEYTLDELFNGSDENGSFPGFVRIVRSYLHSCNPKASVLYRLERYIQLISQRASGECMTAATWIRRFFMNHPEYKHDSVVTQKMTYDLVKKVLDLESGGFDSDLLGKTNA
ncbi:glutamate-cysteine ligase Gcs1 [Schizosaccharomyces japonicus yFS275]|uniref:Glutamate--cysteine ligase n=1 Tax=Schizosaccharomyces japonicus (strain yFS275 / FY16936) TaxID=402676 RepID=B6JX60_SCHJY|nr:glutamate-cysteine ligase Gcs1 [Schizosaccharomyces japonicus yFS275]EEB05961.1 glutamate-cysteine ligase Gcs1 [Schizosaccharomyces japonicus yFS275]